MTWTEGVLHISDTFEIHGGYLGIISFGVCVIAEVKGIEIANSFIQPYSPYGLCFGGIFTDEHKKQMKIVHK